MTWVKQGSLRYTHKKPYEETRRKENLPVGVSVGEVLIVGMDEMVGLCVAVLDETMVRYANVDSRILHVTVNHTSQYILTFGRCCRRR